jgi:hypothetical protein
MDGERRHVPVIWITEYLHVFCPSGQLRCSKIAPGNFYPAIPRQSLPGQALPE